MVDRKLAAKPLSCLRAQSDLFLSVPCGGQSAAGDTLITFDSGYYEAILSARRKDHESCWIVCVSFLHLCCFESALL